MAVQHVYSDDSFENIQTVINDASTTDEVRWHNGKHPLSWIGPSGPQPPTEQPPNIKLLNKGTQGQPFRIIGWDDRHDQAFTMKSEDMPFIPGGSPTIMVPPKPILPEESKVKKSKNDDCGIFYIGPGCFVEISGLHLKHEISLDAYDSPGSAHGSATIVHLVGNMIVDPKHDTLGRHNAPASSLTIKNCVIETEATAAISVRSDADPGLNPATHQVTIQDCEIIGHRQEASTAGEKTKVGLTMAGNYSSVNLGLWGAKPLDMSKSRFEVSGCQLDSVYLGVVGWNVNGDSESKFIVARNHIGTKRIDGTAVGVSFASYPGNPVVALPKGTIAILENEIKVGKRMPPIGAAGIMVHVKMDMDSISPALVEEHQRRTVISGNWIGMDLPDSAQTAGSLADGIVYQYEAMLVPQPPQPPAPGTDTTEYTKAMADFAKAMADFAKAVETDADQSVTACIHNNEVSCLAPWKTVMPRSGIYLGPGAHLVRVTENRMLGCTAAEALVKVDSTASRNTFVGNTIGKLKPGGVAGILCDGNQNSFVDNDFSQSEFLGPPTASGPNWVKLGTAAQKNVAILEKRHVPSGTTFNDLKALESYEPNVVVVLPEFDFPGAIAKDWDVVPIKPPEPMVGKDIGPIPPIKLTGTGPKRRRG